MKKVIRRNVFETNSSSTHSLTIKKQKLLKTIDKDASFEIRSPLRKTVWLLGIIDNAQKRYDDTLYFYFDDEISNQILQSIIELVKSEPTLYQTLNSKYKGDILNNANIFELHDEIIDLGYPHLATGKDFTYLTNYDTLKFLNRFKDILINSYSEIKKTSIEKAKEDIVAEAFNIDKNQNKKQLQDCISCKSKINCYRYFKHKSIEECNCGFQSPEKILNALNKFNINTNSTNEELIKGAKKFLSKRFKIVGLEYYGGYKKLNNKTIY